MLTPYLEQLIHEGKAKPKTFIVGGAEKYILNVPDDRYIIITGISYSNSVNNALSIVTEAQYNLMANKINTQLKIFSTNSLNTFLFRNNFNVTPLPQAVNPATQRYLLTPQGVQNLDTYLIHTNDVSFTFCYAGGNVIVLKQNAPANTIAYPSPMDYGAEGITPVIQTLLVGRFAIPGPLRYYVPSGNIAAVPPGTEYTREYVTPVTASNAYTDYDTVFNMPIVNVQYVEIYGTPPNQNSSN